MNDAEIKELTMISSKFDNIDIKDLNTLKSLKYFKISPEKLLELVKLAKENNKEALTILIKYYYPFIVNIAYKYFIEGIDLEDLVTTATIGFIEGIKKFECGNIKQWTYYCMRKNIYKEIGLQFTSAKLGNDFDYIIFLYLKYLEALKNGQIEELNKSQLATKLGVDLKSLEQILTLEPKDNILDIKKSRNDLKIGDDDYYSKDDLIMIIDKYLPPNYGQIFKMHYGLLDGKPLTQRAIAKIVKVSPARVEEILKKCMFILNMTTAKKKLMAYYYTDYIEPYILSKKVLISYSPTKKI